MAVLVAKIYKIPFPKNFREEKERLEEKMTKEEERREKLSLKPLLEVGEEVYAAWCK